MRKDLTPSSNQKDTRLPIPVRTARRSKSEVFSDNKRREAPRRTPTDDGVAVVCNRDDVVQEEESSSAKLREKKLWECCKASPVIYRDKTPEESGPFMSGGKEVTGFMNTRVKSEQEKECRN